MRLRKLLLLLLLGLAPREAFASDPIRIAVTFDDLPTAGVPVPGWSEARVLTTIADALHAHGVPEAVGFFSGGNMDQAPETRRALDAWLAGGYVLGNHTFSHLNADTSSARSFERDIARNQALIVELAHPAESTYFRYPYLDRGLAPHEAQIHEYLAHHDYRVADVSVDFEDWAFSAAYGRCLAQRDEAALRGLRDAYLKAALSELAWSRAALAQLGHPNAPLVLLLHANFMTAQMLDTLLRTYEDAGARFVTLREALDDGIYARAQTTHHGDGNLIAALLRELHRHTRSEATLPHVKLRTTCMEPRAR